MIEIIEGLPDNIVGIVAKGRVTKKDCADVLTPALEKSLEWHRKLRLYYEIRTRYPGAAWDEVSIGIAHEYSWERVAIVADAAWLRHTVTALRLLLPSEIRVFATNQIPEGLAWITGEPARKRRLEPVPAPRPRSEGGSFRPPVQYLHQIF